MKVIGTLLVALVFLGAAASDAEMPKGPPSKNMLIEPCQKCA